jgi:hypothetical protein
VSVVIACYNGSAHLREQLRSVLDQTAPPSEVIISDDGSSDDTLAVAHAVAATANTRVEIVQNVERLGYAENFLRAATRATGDLVAFADQDDVWLPGKLAAALTAFEDPAMTLWLHGSTPTDERLTPLVDRRVHTGIARRAARANPLQPLHGSHLVFRADLLRYLPAIGRTVSVYGPHPAEHDEWVTFAAHVLGQIGWHPGSLMLYRRHATTVTQIGSVLTRAQVLGGIEETRFASAVEAARQRAEYLEARSEAQACAHVRDELVRAASRYRQLLPRLVRRVRSRQAPSRTQRAVSLLSATAQGDYRAQEGGGLGLWAFVQDSYRVSFPGDAPAQTP